MKNVCHATLFSHIVYGIQVWGDLHVTHRKAIPVLQKRVIKLITYNDQFPTIPGHLPASTPIYCKLGLLKLKDILILRICVFKYVYI